MEQKQLTFKQLSQIFITFLKEHNVLEEYRTNFIRQSNRHKWTFENYLNPLTTTKMTSFIIKGEIGELINYAFTWANTDQGHNFWQHLSCEWKRKWRTLLIQENIDKKILI